MRSVMLAFGFTCALGSALLVERTALACGCLAPPTPATPVVQAGERILFAHDGNDVLAYIQISYKGAADQFGWLVPLPSVPTLELGSNELFTALEGRTQVSYRLNQNRLYCQSAPPVSHSSDPVAPEGGCGYETAPHDASFGADLSARYGSDLSAAAAFDLGKPGPLVDQSDLGPYDYAVLKADDQTAMFQWLSDNRYYVPGGTMDVVAPYIHPGAYFLALKLKGGQSTGDIQPIVLRYASDLPMIPLILTSVGAVPDMGIEVFLLGNARAIPRNYRHVVLDDLPVWLNRDYPSLVVRAVREAPLHHAFVTEYAGRSSVMSGVLTPPGRFGDPAELRQLTDPVQFLAYLRQFGFAFDTTLLAILSRYLPEPPSLVQQGLSLTAYYTNYAYYSTAFGPFDDGGAPPAFDPVACTDEIEMRVVQPTQRTSALFDTNPYLTRLYTAISPEDMTADPVFSENPDLPNVSPVHTATQTIPCHGSGWLDSDQELSIQYPTSLPNLPAALRIETLREAGAPIVDLDNTATIWAAIGPVEMNTDTSPDPTPTYEPQPEPATGRGCACDLLATRARLDAGLLLLAAGLFLIIRRRRRAS
jgi:hypothetical protein